MLLNSTSTVQFHNYLKNRISWFSVSAIEVDRGQLERILTREFETRVHRASDAELLKLLQQLSVPQGLDFPAPRESSSVFENITKPVRKQEIKPPKEQDIKPAKEQEIEEIEEQEIDQIEKQKQDFFDDLTSQMQDLKQKTLNFGLDLNRLGKALRYALASGIAIPVVLFGLKSVMTQEQDSTETSEEETELISEQQEEDEPPEDQTPTDGVLWRRSGVQTDSLEDQSFEVEWQDDPVAAEQNQDGKAEIKQEITELQEQDEDGVQEQEITEAQKQDPVEGQKQDPVEDQTKDQEQDHENQDQEQEEEIMISRRLPRPNWKASEILSNVDSNHSATLLPNILRLSKRD